jgi:2-iminobutanoate/2-iminopropanoate deaminase
MNIEILKTDKSPAAVGPYAQAVKCGDFVFTSGMIPIDVKTGNIETKCIKASAEIVFTNITELLKSQGLSLSNIVKTTVFMTDLGEFNEMTEVYARFFKGHLPARSTVEVSALPKGVRLEVETIAAL